jgi:transposase-like protein
MVGSGRLICEIAGDLDMCLVTLKSWKRELRDSEPVTTPNPNMTKELGAGRILANLDQLYPVLQHLES